MTNIDDARRLAASLRKLGDPHAGLMAHTIEAALDDAEGVYLENQAPIGLSRQDRDDLVVALTIAIIPLDGRNAGFHRFNDLLGRLHSLEFPQPAFPGTDPTVAPEEPASETES